MAAKEATIRAKLTLNGSQFHAGLKAAKGAASGFARSIGGLVTSPLAAIGGAIAGVFTAGAFAHGIKGVLDLGGSLEDLKNQTGESAGNLLLFQQVLKDNGVEAEATGSILNKMQKTIAGAAGGASDMANALGEVGLSYRDLISLSPVEQFRKIGKAISGLESPLLRAKAARDIFGKQGGMLLGALGDEQGFTTAAKSLGRQAELLSKNSAAFDQISDRLGRAGLKLQGFFVGVASELVPALNALTSVMDQADFAAQGERFGAGIKTAADYLVGVFAKPELIAAPLKNYLKALVAEVGNDFLSMAHMLATGGLYQGGKGDVFGAQKLYSAAIDSAKLLADAGKSFEKSMSDGADSTAKAVDKVKGFVSTSSLNQGQSGLRTNGNANPDLFYRMLSQNAEVHASSLFGTYNHSPVLGFRDRQRLMDDAVANGQTRAASSAGAYGAVRSGDARRRKEVERQRLIKEQGVDKTNSLLTEILAPTKKTADTVSSW